MRIMFKACIFDLDGTIMNTLESIAYVSNLVLKELSLPPFPVDDYRYFSGEGGRMLMTRCLKRAGAPRGLLNQAVTRYNELFSQNSLYQVKACKGVPELLSALKKERLSLAVLSNKPHEAALRAVRGVYGENYFKMVRGLQSDADRKPSPKGALTIARELKVHPEECLYVGDTGTDMDTGNAAGMFSIGVLWGFRDRQELAEHDAKLIVSNPEEILSFCKEKNALEKIGR